MKNNIDILSTFFKKAIADYNNATARIVINAFEISKITGNNDILVEFIKLSTANSEALLEAMKYIPDNRFYDEYIKAMVAKTNG